MHPLIPIHVAAGGVALIAGALAMTARKGGRFHGRAGTWFFAAMLTMAGTGSVIALAKPERGTAVIGVLTSYLVLTSWMAARRRDGRAGRFEVVAMVVALVCAALMLTIGLIGLGQPRGRLDLLPAVVHFPFAALALLAAALDLNFILRREISGVQRTGRHLWRMSAAFLIAASSFFQGQQDRMPEFVQGSPFLSVPPLAVLAAMIFWIFRVRFSRAFHWVAPRRVRTAAGARVAATASKSA
jgi:uncharacterized membrane protein